MKIRIERNELVRGINIVQRAIPSKSIMPILKGLLLIAEDSKLRLVANDMQLSIDISIDAQVVIPGSIVVDCKILADIIRRLPEGCIDFSVNDLSIEVRCEDFKINLIGYDASDFPELPNTTEENIIHISQNKLSKMVKETIFAVSKSEHLQVITGVFLETCDNDIIMAATDGYRFALTKDTFNNAFCRLNKKIIPGSSLMEIGKIFSDNIERQVKIALEEKYAVFIVDNIKITTRLLQGNFINHKTIMPQSYDTEIIINTKALINAFEITSIFAAYSNSGVRFNISDCILKISSNANIGDITKEIKVQHYGEDLVIAFNINYLIDGLRVIDEDEVKLCFAKGSNSPCVMKPVSSSLYEYLVLPVRINSNIIE